MIKAKPLDNTGKRAGPALRLHIYANSQYAHTIHTHKTHTHRCTHTHKCRHTHMHTHATHKITLLHARTYTHAHTHTHTHTQVTHPYMHTNKWYTQSLHTVVKHFKDMQIYISKSATINEY